VNRTHVVVTFAQPGAIPVVIALAGVLVLVGVVLSMAGKLPVLAYFGSALALAGLLLGTAQELAWHNTWLMVAEGCLAAYQAVRLYSQRSAVR
jgi:hypothetical protein